MIIEIAKTEIASFVNIFVKIFFSFMPSLSLLLTNALNKFYVNDKNNQNS